MSIRRRSWRDWAADCGLLLLVAGLGWLFLLAIESEGELHPGWPLWEGTFLVVTATGLITLRRRFPVWLAVAYIPMALASATGIGAATAALFSLAVRRSWRVTACVFAVDATVLLCGYGFDADSRREFLESAITVMLLHSTLAAIGMLIRSQRQLILAAEERARQAEEGQRLRVEEARHLERERLAREMHDVLAHRISLLAVHAGALEFRAEATEEESRAAGVIRQCAYEAMEDLREVLTMLREGPAGEGERPQPTLTELPDLIEQSRLTGAHVTLDSRVDDLPAVPARIGRHAYRIVQEGLTNARKHAPGAHVRVTVDASDGTDLMIEVANPLPLRSPVAAQARGAAEPFGDAGTRGGAGMPGGAGTPDAGTSGAGAVGGAAGLPGAGTGLIGLAERVGLVGGRLEHGPTADGHFRLRARLPWPT